MNQLIKPKKNNYRAVYFDLDGTLTDSKEGITNSIRFALEKIHVAPPTATDLNGYIGLPLKEVFISLTSSTDEALLKDAIHYYRQRYADKGILENRLYDGVEEMLARLSDKNYKLFIVTAKPQIFALQVLNQFNLAHYFETIYGTNMDGLPADKSEQLKSALENNTQDTPSLMVGDRKFDMIAALKNHIDPLGVTYGYGSPEELVLSGAYHLCQSPLDVYQWIHS